MDSNYSYIDMFATKDIEYLIILGFFVVLIVFWRYLHINDD